MNETESPSLLLCRVGGQFLGVRLHTVERVERAVEIRAVPDAPAGLCGVINVRGEVVPVLDPRPGLGLESRPVGVADQLVLLRVWAGGVGQPAALLVDETLGIVSASVATSGGQEPGSPAELVAGMSPGDEVMIVGERLVIVRPDGVLVPPWVRDALSSVPESVADRAVDHRSASDMSDQTETPS